MQNCLYKLQKLSEVNQMKFTEVQSIAPFVLLTYTSTFSSILPKKSSYKLYKGTFRLTE